jgi:hypothetical protein
MARSLTPAALLRHNPPVPAATHPSARPPAAGATASTAASTAASAPPCATAPPGGAATLALRDRWVVLAYAPGVRTWRRTWSGSAPGWRAALAAAVRHADVRDVVVLAPGGALKRAVGAAQARLRMGRAEKARGGRRKGR